MNRSKKKQSKREAKISEAKRLEKQRSELVTEPISGNKDKRMIGSDGYRIPSESERREHGDITDAPLVRKAKPREIKIGSKAADIARRNGAKVKTRYMLDANVKKLLIAIIIAIVAIIAVIATSIIAGSNSGKQIVQNSDESISLIGLTSASKTVIDSTSKFDGFDSVDGVPLSDAYDTLITQDDAQLLEQRGQYPTDGIFAYNTDISSKNNR